MAQASYITPAEFAEVYDTRMLEQYSSDDTTAVTPDISVDAEVLMAIERGSSDVETAAIYGGRYTLANLATLQADDNWTLKGLVADRAMYHLMKRRAGTLTPVMDQVREESEGTLDAIRNGRDPFGLGSDIGSSAKGDIHVIPADTRGRLNLVSDEPFWPNRQTEEW